MYSDTVFPKNNEEKFIDIALKLGYSTLFFVYEPKNFKKYESKEIKIFSGIISKNKIKNSDFIITKANDNIRPILEKAQTNIVFDFELSERKDFIHHRNSGLNQVLCKIMKDKKIILGFSFSSILNSKNPQHLGRIMQNIQFARKYKIKTAFASLTNNPYEMRSPKDLITFLEVLGMHPKQAQDSLKPK